MTFPTRRQSTTSTQTSLTATANTYAFGSACVAGNLIVVCLAGDKNTGTLSVSDNVSGATGWTIETAITGASVSLYVARKVAVGGETTITATTSTAPGTGNTGYAEEIADDGTGAWTVVAKATPAYSDTSRASAASGTTDTADYDGRALAIGVIDSMSSIGTEAQRTLPTFTNFTKINDPAWPAGSGGGSAGCYVGSANLAAGATTSSTFATNGGSDQLTCAIVAFGRVESATPAPTVNAGADVTGHVAGTEFTRFATENDNGSPITARGWQITAGPADVGASNTTLGVSYTPTVTGTYTFTYSATNAGGTSSDSMTLQVVAAAALEPVDIIPFGVGNGLVHYAFDIGQEAGGGRQLYYPATIAADLEFDPEFLAVTDGGINWVQAAVRADATTTSGSTNPRSEGRETKEGAAEENGDAHLGFDPRTGTHWQRARVRVMEHPTNAANIGTSVVQLHSAADDILMVRTRVRSDGTVDLVLREYQPSTGNSADVLTLITGYTFGQVVDLLILEHNGKAYVFLDDFLVPVWRTNPAVWPVTGTYMHKWGTYIQNTAAWATTAWGRAHFRNVAHHHTGWAAPTNYAGWPEVNPGAAASATVGQAFTRTATDSGSGITERKWAILEGPAGVGTTIGTAAALSWTPTAAGEYTLVYGAKNAEGWSHPAFLTVTASAGSVGAPAEVRATVTGSGNTQVGSYAITLPTRQVGDALIVAFANDEVGGTGAEVENFADPDAASQARGWSRLITEEQGTTTNHRFTIFYKASAQGGTADDLTVTLVDPEEATWVAQSIANPGGAPTVQMDEGGSGSAIVGVPYSGLTPSPWLSLIYLGMDSSTTTTQDPVMADPQSAWVRLAAINPTVTSSAATFAWARQMPAGTTDIDAGTITPSTGEQWIRYHVIFPGSSAVAPTVGAGADATIDQYDTFTRTATEDNGGATITSRAWTVQSGPNEVGATIGTAAALSWKPTVGGVYVLRYTATNSAGSGFDEVTVTVDALVFPLTAPLRLTGSAAVAKATGQAVTAPLRLSASTAAAKQAIAAPTAPLRLTASMVGKKINAVTATLRLSASIEASSGQGAHVTASLRLSAGVDNVSRATPDPVPVTSEPLRLTAAADTSSAREPADVAAALQLSMTSTSEKRMALAPTAPLRLSAAVDDISRATLVALSAPLRLSASVSDRFHVGGSARTAPLRLTAAVATSSTRNHRQLPVARLRLFGNALGQRIVAAITAVQPRADTTVRYDLVAVARVPQAAGPPMFIEIDPVDWTELSWTEALNEPPTLSATAKIDTLTDPILQRLRVPHELPTELWCYRNGRAVFAGPLLGGRVNGDSISLEAGGLETYLRWMHVVQDLQFTNADQFSIVRALIDQWQGLEYGHFGIDSGSGVVGLLPEPVPGQATYQAANRTAENSDDDLTLARPSGTKPGDLLLVAHVCDTDGGLTAMTAPTGWTLAGEQGGVSDIPRLKIWWKIATESEPSSYVFRQDDQDGAAGILRIDGHNGLAPLAVTPVFASSSTSSSSHVAPSVTGVQGGLLVTVACADTNGSRRVYSQAPAGMEERVDIGANSAVLGMFTQPLTAAGATGTRTAVCSGSHDWIAASLVIAPAPPAPPPLTDNGPKSGITRSVSYFASELHNVFDRVTDLAKAADGFDLVIDPITRRVELYHPGRGIDRSSGEDAIVFDSRNLTSSDIAFSISPQDLASDGFATGTTGGSDAPRTAKFANLELRAKFGRTGVTGTFEVTDQASLDAYVASLVAARDRVLLIPGPNARVTLDADLGSYDVGDTVSFTAHGRLTTADAWRIRKRTVRVGKANTESVGIEFV